MQSTWHLVAKGHPHPPDDAPPDQLRVPEKITLENMVVSFATHRAFNQDLLAATSLAGSTGPVSQVRTMEMGRTQSRQSKS
jgi:hypothetical protein